MCPLLCQQSPVSPDQGHPPPARSGQEAPQPAQPRHAAPAPTSVLAASPPLTCEALSTRDFCNKNRGPKSVSVKPRIPKGKVFRYEFWNPVLVAKVSTTYEQRKKRWGEDKSKLPENHLAIVGPFIIGQTAGPDWEEYDLGVLSCSYDNNIGIDLTVQLVGYGGETGNTWQYIHPAIWDNI